MDAYRASPGAVLLLVAIGMVLLVAGRALERLRPAWALTVAWGVLPTALAIAGLALDTEPPGTRMLGLVAMTFLAMKLVVLAAGRQAGGPALPISRWLQFTLLWPGMTTLAFDGRLRRRPAAQRLGRRGLRNLVAGLLLIALARVVGPPWGIPVLMIGLSLALHFGLFTLLAAWFRHRGLPVRLPFDAPLQARTLAEFWGQRWNRGFAEMTAQCVQRPLQRRFRRRPALLASFAFSGLLHEVALSWPVRAGFGLPTVYFLLHGALVAWGHGRGRWPVLLAIVLPVPLVFHPWFVTAVITPLLG